MYARYTDLHDYKLQEIRIFYFNRRVYIFKYKRHLILIRDEITEKHRVSKNEVSGLYPGIL